MDNMYSFKRFKEVAKRPLVLAGFKKLNPPVKVGPLLLTPPDSKVNVRLMKVRDVGTDISLPEMLEWVRPMVEMTEDIQTRMGIFHPFCYITVRMGVKHQPLSGDGWHTDGYSSKYTHLPEQSYIWTNENPTEFATKSIKFPKDFDDKRHNVHKYIHGILHEHIHLSSFFHTGDEETVYGINPYVIHRRPHFEAYQNNTNRIFVRVTFCPIEIVENNLTVNPSQLVKPWNRNAVTWREGLNEYIPMD